VLPVALIQALYRDPLRILPILHSQRCRSLAAIRAVLLEKIQFSACGNFNAVLTPSMMATQVSLGYYTLV
jgi:hypothetical protein